MYTRSIELCVVAEREYLLEYYSLVHEGKTNYTATTAFLAYFGHRGQEPSEFFKTYSVRFNQVNSSTALWIADVALFRRSSSQRSVK